MNHPAVEAENLVKTYTDWRRRGTPALQGVSLRVEPGTIFGLLGRNGAGKTTLVKILLRLVIPDGGSAQVLGSKVSEYKIRRRVGYLPEQIQLPEYLKPAAFLRYMGEFIGCVLPESTRQCEEPSNPSFQKLFGRIRLCALFREIAHNLMP